MTERTVHPRRRLGRRPPKMAPALRFKAFWSGAVPAHPHAADNLSNVREWELGANDQFGTCGPTSVANMRRQVVTYLAALGESFPTLDDVFDLYRRSGNPGFDPATGADDNGVDMQTMLEELLKGGIGGVKPLAFAKVDVHQIDELRAAIAIFGGLLYGVDLQVSQQAQTDAKLWDWKRSGEWGGHAILAGRYTGSAGGDDIGVVTWGQIVGTTDAFEAHQLEEAWIVIWPEHLGTEAFQAGVDKAKLATSYQALTGRPFPVAPPAPAPSPEPAAALHDLAALLRRAWTEMEAWLQHHGL
jgi:hypothetical protein